jgi:hypothetical protein
VTHRPLDSLPSDWREEINTTDIRLDRVENAV